MLSRARRVANSAATRLEWPVINGGADTATPPAPLAPLATPPPGPVAVPAPPEVTLAEIERDAFAQGYQQGERAGADAGRARVDAMLARLGDTIDELAGLRRGMLAQTERQLVQLALAIAKRIVHHEVAMDPELTLVTARLALDRLGSSQHATIRLHPDDCASAAHGREANWAGDGVVIVADPSVSRGSCLVESDAGFIDASVEAQFAELTHALLLDDDARVGMGVAVRHGD